MYITVVLRQLASLSEEACLYAGADCRDSSGSERVERGQLFVVKKCKFAVANTILSCKNAALGSLATTLWRQLCSDNFVAITQYSAAAEIGGRLVATILTLQL